MTHDDRLRIAVFIDFDNIEIGVKNTLGASFDAGLVLEALRERGDVVSKTAYSDWQRAGNYSRMLTQHAIKMVQRNLTPGGDKNGADINLALDALEMAFTHPHINAFVIVGGDSDFISLVEKLKQYDKKIFVVGGRQFTSIIMQRNCHEFIAYENLTGATASAGGGRRQSGRGVRVERAPVEQAVPLVSRALEVLSEREVSPQLGLLKSTLLQLDSTFSERDYGVGSFRDFVQKLEKIGVVTVQQGKGGLLVLPGEGAAPAGSAPPAPAAAAPSIDESDDTHEAPARGSSRGNGRGAGGATTPAPPVTGTNAQGLAEFRRILALGRVRRWPMYLRNVKQMIKQVSADFDERAYGFANLVDLLRAAAREGHVRVDRDRQGVIRVFQGAAPAAAPVPEAAGSGSAAEAAGEAAAALAEAGQPRDEDAGAVVIEFPLVEEPSPEPAASDTGADPEDDDDNIGNRIDPAAASGSRRRASTTARKKKAPASTSTSSTSRRKTSAAGTAEGKAPAATAKKRAPRARRPAATRSSNS